ncbi:hypothetical protein ABET39_22900 [Metabacillus fastidiosus]
MEKGKRLPVYALSSSIGNSVKTFDGKMYLLKGAIAVESNTGEIKRVADIYYRVRSIVDEKHNVVAKRKHEHDELKRVN